MSSAIETDGLGYRYRRDWAVRDLSLAVPRGAVFGLLGTNGAGKSTTIRLLMGLLRRHAGAARVLGMDPGSDPVGVKRAVGYVAESQGFYPWMRVEELLAFVARYRPEWDAEHAESLRRQFDLPLAARISELSKGSRARVALLLALAFRPRLLILDEPTAGLDPRARQLFFEGMLAGFQDDGGTIFVSSHLIHEISGLVDHVGILDGGRLLLSLPAEELHRTVRRYRLTFADAVPDDLGCPGLLRRTLQGREAVVTARAGDHDTVRAALAGRGPARLVEEPLKLEEIFVDLVDGGGAADAG